MKECNVVVSKNGGITIPAIYRRELNINSGDKIILSISPEKDIIIHSPKQSLKKLQALFAKKEKESLVDELFDMHKNEGP